jgi:PBP1b-binding outer membrane lipoprotein LpoB
MKIARYISFTCCIVLLSGCFDSPDEQSTKQNTDNSKSSVQMDKK